MKHKDEIRSFRSLEAEYFIKNPNEVSSYIEGLFDDYAKDRNDGALLASLRVIAQVCGVGDLAKKAGLTRQGLQNALSSKGNPRFSTIMAIMDAMGYRLKPCNT